MRAVYINRFGAFDDLEFRETADLGQPQKTQVLVRVKAAGLNRADLLQVRGHYPPPEGYSPNIPGLEFAGEIAAVGNDARSWNIGDRVFGITSGEAQAEYLITDSRLLAPVPVNLSFAEAAAIPEAFITAHDAIFTQGNLKSGETLLIHAVGSGVGLAALQLAKAKGATVIGSSRTADKLERCAAFGLDVAVTVDGEPDFANDIEQATGGRGVDIVLDLVGAAYFKQNLASLTQKGRLLLVGLTSGSKAEFDLGVALRKRLKIIGTMLRGRTTEEKEDATRKFVYDVLPLLRNGSVRPTVDRVFPVEEVRDAYSYLASNESFGKVVLEF
jgi:NADPH:quinone reductase